MGTGLGFQATWETHTQWNQQPYVLNHPGLYPLPYLDRADRNPSPASSASLELQRAWGPGVLRKGKWGP